MSPMKYAPIKAMRLLSMEGRDHGKLSVAARTASA
jgi:hypothetical protein